MEPHQVDHQGAERVRTGDVLDGCNRKTLHLPDYGSDEEPRDLADSDQLCEDVRFGLVEDVIFLDDIVYEPSALLVDYEQLPLFQA